jgi:altronate hydrolase
MPDFEEVLIQLHPRDSVAITKTRLEPETVITQPTGKSLTVRETVPSGHKIAVQNLASGVTVLRYGSPIGVTTQPISAGSWIHTHNLAFSTNESRSECNLTAAWKPEPSGRTFEGYARPNGKVGTRNYIAVIASVTCSNHVTSQITRAFPAQALEQYPHVDGVIPILHSSGCALPPGGRSHQQLKRTLTNIAQNPNIAAVIYVGLGCELMQIDDCQPLFTAQEIAPLGLVIQEEGGFEKTVTAGIVAVQKLLPQINQIERTPQPVSHLLIALQCGGSDSWSGVTANPLVGQVSDQLVMEGGTVVLAETPEIHGAEANLLHRVTSTEIGQKLIQHCQQWQADAQAYGFSLDNNPSPGNKKGGLTTILEKSLGAVAKAGKSPLKGVYDYGELVTNSGLVFMDTPGNDAVSITGQLAGGCNLIIFTTGRGTVFGSNIAPCLKIATNARLYHWMQPDMDFNAGQLLEGSSWKAAQQELFDIVIATASGRRTASEKHGLSENEFVPWQPDPIL